MSFDPKVRTLERKLVQAINDPPDYIPDVVIRSIRSQQEGPNPFTPIEDPKISGDQVFRSKIEICGRLFRLLSDKKEMPKAWNDITTAAKDNEDGILSFFLVALDNEYHFNLSEWKPDWNARSEQHKQVAEKARELLNAMGQSPINYLRDDLFEDLNFLCCPDWENDGRHDYRNSELWENYHNNLADGALPGLLRLLASSAEVGRLVNPARKPRRKIMDKTGARSPSAKINFLILALGQVVEQHFTKPIHSAIARTVNTAIQPAKKVNADNVKLLINRKSQRVQKR